MGHCQPSTVQIPLDLPIKNPGLVCFNVSAFSLANPHQQTEEREEHSGLFNNSFSGVWRHLLCAVHCMLFSCCPTQGGRGGGGLDWDDKIIIYFFLWVSVGLICTHLCSSVVMLSRKYSRGVRLSSYTALSCIKYIWKHKALWSHFYQKQIHF